MLEDLELSKPDLVEVPELSEPGLVEVEEPASPRSNRVFVVHGRDNEMKQAVARTLERLGLETVILHERPGA